ncbi:MAG: DUF2339 domain-containing protein [Thermodesulfobacteriota bacterium]
MQNNIEALKLELVRLRQDFQKRTEILGNRITLLEKESSKLEHLPELVPAFQEDTPLAHSVTEAPKVNEEKHSDLFSQEKPPLEKQATEKCSEAPEAVLKEQLLHSIMPMAMPGIFKTVLPIYDDYKGKGKLPVFFMTLAGLVTLTFGFGYLLQYSFNHWFGPATKMALCFTGSCAILFTGTRLYRRELFRSYASSIIGISIVLNYLCVYFLTIYYQLVGINTGYTLLLLNTIFAFFLASTYTTRIVAVITFIGGAFTPFFLDIESIQPVFYLAYLLLIAMSALKLARHLDWPPLAHGSFLILAGIIEFLVFEVRLPPNILTILLLQIFFYIYCYHCLFWDRRPLEKLDKTRLLILAANISLLLVNLKGLISSGGLSLGVLYILNAVPFMGVLGWKWKNLSDTQRTFLISITASFLGFSIPAIFGSNLMALFWAQEGLLLIFLGFLFSGYFVRKEGYALLTISLLQIIILIPEMLGGWPDIFTLSGYWNVVAVGIFLWLTIIISTKNLDKLESFEQELLRILQESYSFWVVIIFFITTAALFSSYCYTLAVLPMFYILYRGDRLNLQVSQCLGVILYAALIIGILVSMATVESYHFRDQTIAGKISIIEAIIVLRLFFTFLQRVAPANTLMPLACNARILFYMLLPVLWLPSLRHHLPDFLPLGLWGAVVICFVLQEKKKIHSIMQQELYILSICAALFSSFSCFYSFGKGIINPASISLVTGIVLCLGLYLKENGMLQKGYYKSDYKFLLTGSWLYGCIALFLITYGVSNNLALTLLLTGAVLSFVTTKRPVIHALRPCWRLVYYSGKWSIVLAVLYSAANITRSSSNTWMYWGVGLAGLACLTIDIYYNPKFYRIISGLRRTVSDWKHKTDLWLLHFLFLLFYIRTIYLFSDVVVSPIVSVALLIHGLTLFFHTGKKEYKTLLKLAMLLLAAVFAKVLFYDMVNFSLLQKVMAFMLMAALLLGSAYGLQRRQNQAIILEGREK